MRKRNDGRQRNSESRCEQSGFGYIFIINQKFIAEMKDVFGEVLRLFNFYYSYNKRPTKVEV